MQYTGASLLMELLKRQGIGIVAGIPGGANLPVYDALGQSDLRHILVRPRTGGRLPCPGNGSVDGQSGSLLCDVRPGRGQSPDRHR